MGTKVHSTSNRSTSWAWISNAQQWWSSPTNAPRCTSSKSVETGRLFEEGSSKFASCASMDQGMFRLKNEAPRMFSAQFPGRSRVTENTRRTGSSSQRTRPADRSNCSFSSVYVVDARSGTFVASKDQSFTFSPRIKRSSMAGRNRLPASV